MQKELADDGESEACQENVDGCRRIRLSSNDDLWHVTVTTAGRFGSQNRDLELPLPEGESRASGIHRGRSSRRSAASMGGVAFAWPRFRPREFASRLLRP